MLKPPIYLRLPLDLAARFVAAAKSLMTPEAAVGRLLVKALVEAVETHGDDVVWPPQLVTHKHVFVQGDSDA